MKTLAPISFILHTLFTVALPITVVADDLRVPSDDHPDIQSAVDFALDGDTIYIAAGVYVEQTRIVRKNLTLVGEPGTILRAFPNMDPAIPGDVTSQNVLFIHLSSNVVLRELSFEGDQLADQQAVSLNGVYYLDSGGAVENCRFTGFRERVAGSIPGRAIRCVNDLRGAPLYSFRAVENTIQDSYLGMQVIGAPDTLSLEITLENNRIQGVGPSENSSSEMRGMDLGDGITGSVADNTISGFSYNGEGAEFPWGWGIIAIGRGFPNHRALEPIQFENNNFKNNNLHLVVIEGRKVGERKCQVLNNRFEGTGPGLSQAGVWFTGGDVEVSRNTFRDMPNAVIVGGDDPILGSDLGIATDAVLVDNRFSGVDKPIDHQPQSTTAVEEGTLIAPFPEPELEIGKAVRLSWSNYYDDYFLEGAPSPQGPWSSAEFEPRDNAQGALEVFVPIREHQQFFRLYKMEGSEDR